MQRWLTDMLGLSALVVATALPVGCGDGSSAGSPDAAPTADASPADAPPAPPAEYFLSSYAENRAAFGDQASYLQAIYPDMTCRSLVVPDQPDPDLTTEFCHLPARSTPRRLLILTSGVHGIEGFVGTTMQSLFMSEILPGLDLADTGVLLVHALNPSGFKQLRRVNENNVDLYRNCDIDPALYQTENEAYRSLNDFINPTVPVDATSLDRDLFLQKVLDLLGQYSMDTLKQALLGGQYEFPDGVYYGGSALQPQIVAIRPLLESVVTGYAAILHIDFHTGYGARGRLHYFPDPVDDPELKALTEQVFAGYQIDWPNTSEFYTISGSYLVFVGELVPPGTPYVSMSFEYGTMDSQTLEGEIASAHNMIVENEGFHYGYATPEVETEVKLRFVEMFFPSDEGWRAAVLAQTRESLPVIIRQFQQLTLP